ncbi:hypothetical protein ACV334_37645, partial [Pseudomonas aeruginosa]
TVNGGSIPEEVELFSTLPDTLLRTDKKRGPQCVDEDERKNAERLQNFVSQLVKQADIILLMSLFPDDFSETAKRVAFYYYEPR